MIIKKATISKITLVKINKKHCVRFKEIKKVFLDEPFFKRIKKDVYIAIGFDERYLTIIFSYEKRIATILTAYPSSNWQIKLFKRKK